MWAGLRCGKDQESVRIGHITNGVHVPSWLAPQMYRLYDRHLGAGWHEHSAEARPGRESRVLMTAELWETHLSLKSRLLDSCGGERWNRRNAAAKRTRYSAARPCDQSRRAHDRLCAAVRDLQAGQPDSGGYRETGARWSTIRSARCSSYSRAKRIRTMNRASGCCSRLRN